MLVVVFVFSAFFSDCFFCIEQVKASWWRSIVLCALYIYACITSHHIMTNLSEQSLNDCFCWVQWLLHEFWFTWNTVTYVYDSTQWFIISRPLCLNWYSSATANKRYFWHKILTFHHSDYTEFAHKWLLLSKLYLVLMRQCDIIYSVAFTLHCVHMATRQWRTRLHASVKAKKAALNTACLNKLWLTCIYSVYVRLRLYLKFVPNGLLFQ